MYGDKIFLFTCCLCTIYSHALPAILKPSLPVHALRDVPDDSSMPCHHPKIWAKLQASRSADCSRKNLSVLCLSI